MPDFCLNIFFLLFLLAICDIRTFQMLKIAIFSMQIVGVFFLAFFVLVIVFWLSDSKLYARL